jgi:hypothetical protein
VPYFDRVDVIEAHLVIEAHYNHGGWLHERPSNQRRKESTGVQTHRIGYKPGPSFGTFRNLSENGKDIYRELQRRYGFAVAHKNDACDYYVEGDDVGLEYTTCEDCDLWSSELEQIVLSAQKENS